MNSKLTKEEQTAYDQFEQNMKQLYVLQETIADCPRCLEKARGLRKVYRLN